MLLPAEILQALIKACSPHFQIKNGDITVTDAVLSNAVVHSTCILFMGELKHYKFKCVAQDHTTEKWQSLLSAE